MKRTLSVWAVAAAMRSVSGVKCHFQSSCSPGIVCIPPGVEGYCSVPHEGAAYSGPLALWPCKVRGPGPGIMPDLCDGTTAGCMYVVRGCPRIIPALVS